MDVSRSDRELRWLARECAVARASFVAHMVVAAFALACLGAVNLMTMPDYLWGLWLACAWLIALGAHAVAVYGFPDDLASEQ